MNIEILYFDGCPNHGPTVERVKEALRQEGLTAELVEVNVRDEATAQSVRFLGSPTVQIDGMDVEAKARSSKDFGMMCRTYGDIGKRVVSDHQKTYFSEHQAGRARRACEA